jgi:RNA-directed DNA polymerase
MRNKVRELQRNLYRAAKTNPERCFHSLYDKVCRSDVLWEAWKRVKRNRGAPGNDGETIDAIVERGEVEYLKTLQNELREKRYRAKSIRRVYIHKGDGRLRPLGIPRVRCRIVQSAVRIVLEPILEARFHESSFGFRPKRSAKDVSNRIRKYMNFGYNWVINVDLSSYFDTIPHDRLVELVAKYVKDGNILKLIKGWLRAKVVDKGEIITPKAGSPQGAVLSPLLSNLYLHQFDEEWHRRGNARRLRAIPTRYADDILIQCGREGMKIWEEVQGILTELGLTVNEEKTHFGHAKEGFDYLGFRFIRGYSQRKGKEATYVVPTQKSRKRVWEKVRWYTDKRRYQNLPMEWIVGKLNPILLGWTQYYRHTNSSRVFRMLQSYTNDRIRKATRYRCKKKGVGRYRDLPNCILYKRYGLACIGVGRIEYCWS